MRGRPLFPGSNVAGVDSPALLLFSEFFFIVAGFFWVMCLLSPARDTKVLGFWYAVVAENAGYLLLAVHHVTSS